MPYKYAQLVDLQNHVDVRLLIQLTNDSDAIDPTDLENINETILVAMENEAATTVDNYLRNVYALPLLVNTTLTPEIVRIVAKLTVANLWERRGSIPDGIKDMKGRCYGRLKRMSKPAAEEVRGTRDVVDGAQPIRSTKGKAATVFDRSGYFDGLRIKGTRALAADCEGT